MDGIIEVECICHSATHSGYDDTWEYRFRTRNEANPMLSFSLSYIDPQPFVAGTIYGINLGICSPENT